MGWWLFKLSSFWIKQKGMLTSPKLMALSVLCQLVPRSGCLSSSSFGNTVRMRASLLSTGIRLQGWIQSLQMLFVQPCGWEVDSSPKFKVDSTCVQATAPAKNMKVATDLKPSTSSSCVMEAESNAAISSTTCIDKQTMAKSHVHHIVPVKQEILYDFLLKVDQGRFGIPCGDMVCHSSPDMNHVSWPLEKSVFCLGPYLGCLSGLQEGDPS